MVRVRFDLNTRWTLLMVLVLVLLLAACGVDSDTVETVDDAVKLIQAVDSDSTWGYLTDGLDALAEQDGYVAMITYGYSEAVDGELTVSDASTITIQYTQDGDGDVHIKFTDQQGHQSYYSPAQDPDTDARLVFQMDDGDYACPAATDIQRYANGITSILAFYDMREVLTSTLSVAESDGDSTLIDRDADHYVLESRLPDALDILERTDNTALRERITGTDQGMITGAFDLDDETSALLFFDNVYVFDDLNKQRGLMFSVTQWDAVPDIVIDGELPPCD